MFTLFSILVTVGSMIAIGIIVWKVVQRQESRDPKFKAKLDADDERARAGRQKPS